MATYALQILKVVLALVFLASGLSKLAGAGPTVAMFAQIGLGQNFRYFTGAVEVLGAIGLIAPGFAYYAATLLAAVMIGAIAVHKSIIGGSATPAIVLLLLLIALAWFSRAGQASRPIQKQNGTKT